MLTAKTSTNQHNLCSNCGFELTNFGKYCAKCGTSISGKISKENYHDQGSIVITSEQKKGIKYVIENKSLLLTLNLILPLTILLVPKVLLRNNGDIIPELSPMTIIWLIIINLWNIKESLSSFRKNKWVFSLLVYNLTYSSSLYFWPQNFGIFFSPTYFHTNWEARFYSVLAIGLNVYFIYKKLQTKVDS